MVLRTGKYKGWSIQELQFSDPNYLTWIRGNRPEMLVERKSKPKVELTEEELDQQNNYKKLPMLSWDEAFPR
tara:strand:- start:171 stop:386 length:216 start_codon:yes stop_codon:yes gene_type:complete